MLDDFFVFTRGGLILWSLAGGAALQGSPIDALVRSCLLEGRPAGPAGFSHGPHALRWAFHADLGLVLVAVYRRVLHLLYVDALLAAAAGAFTEIYHPRRASYPQFGDTFRKLHLHAEEAFGRRKDPPPPAIVPKDKPSPATAPNRGAPRDNGGGGDDGDGDADGGDAGKKENVADAGNVVVVVKGGEKEAEEDKGGIKNGAFDVNLIRKLRAKEDQRKKKLNGGGAGNGKKKVVHTEVKKKKKGKGMSDAPPIKLNFSLTENGDARDDVAVIGNKGASMMDTDDAAVAAPKKKGWFTSMFRTIAGNNAIEESDLQPAIGALKDRLMTKNVAEEIAEKICLSVTNSLQGKKLGSFERISSAVHMAMEESLLRILTPRHSIDVLRDVHSAKENGKPYVIVFVGVNGVGKSTNLAKVAYWLLQHDLSVMLAACDTFRSGAVEQLRTHARRLQIPIFEKGYEKDPAAVARDAIQEAARNKSDVVLVDTAGRMQDNEPLMRALSKLINLNKPDLVLFVGEALVGNDAVDQLTKFDQKLSELSTVPTAGVIDGILLTKFDTIDDKVGAALSMVYVSGAPVMFVGCGQSYTDLKKLNVKSIVNTLLM